MAAGELAPREARRDSGMPSTSQQQPDQTGLPQVALFDPAAYSPCVPAQNSRLNSRTFACLPLQAHQLVGTRVLCHTLFDGRQRKLAVLTSDMPCPTKPSAVLFHCC